LVHGIRFTKFDLSFCGGGKEPTEIRGSRNPLAGILGANEEVLNSCAGVAEPHLHVRCRMCGYAWTMRCLEI
jgi:hypothetical protein